MIWGSSENSYFPYTTWIFFPLVGFLFGTALLHSDNKKAFYVKAMLLGFSFWIFSIVVIRNIWNIDIGTATAEWYYHHIFWGNYSLLAFDLFWVGLFYFLKNILPKAVLITLTRWSKQVIFMYLLQWMLIDWSMLFISENSLSLGNYVLLSTLFLVLSDLGAYMLQKKLKKNV